MSQGKAVNSAFPPYESAEDTNRLDRRLPLMKTLLLAILSLCFCVTVVALSQDSPNQAPKTQEAARVRLSIILGTVEEVGDKLRFVTDQRVWNVDNPEILEGHEGHYVHAKAYVYPDKGLVHITEVRIPTARETMEADIK
jgi:hypothetical protein